ncbi:MAG: hypothetical protein KJ052_05440 [Candidatus Hydrogenedentes bacterium]|nr:hypothetical protein [Candidatus Hydrogenedentota bacterium]
MIVVNYATHEHVNVRKWLVKHPRFHIHFTPTSSSWVNLMKPRFGELVNKRIRGAHHENPA